MEQKIILYGANGYTGELIAQKAKKDGIILHLAGRSEEKIKPLADSLGFDYSCFTIADVKHDPGLLKPYDILINCAGPFSATAKPMMEACLSKHCHYLDITGEISVFEAGYNLNSRAVSEGIIVCPGVGFDVIPTDCLAAKLHEAMPDANYLTLAFESTAGKLSPGTTKTSIEGIAIGGRVRRNGKIIDVPLGYKSRSVDLGNGSRSLVTIPWGDVATAGYSTGIANIEVYIPLSPKKIKKLRWLNSVKWLIGTGIVQNFMKRKVDKKVNGPTEEERSQAKTFIWGEVSNGKETKRGSLKTANGYDVTAEGALAIAQYIAENKPEGGYFTPSQLCGNELIETFAGSTPITIVDADNA